MIVKDRKGDWVLRIYSKSADGSWFTGTEQYFPTRALLRKSVKTWKMVYLNSSVQFKIKTYRITFTSDRMPMNESVVWYQETR